MKRKSSTRSLYLLFCGVVVALATASSGCQIVETGQLLPTPWYVYDDVQYFAPTTEFKLPREAAAMQAAKAEQALQQ